jgi:hypothetical protein
MPQRNNNSQLYDTASTDSDSSEEYKALLDESPELQQLQRKLDTSVNELSKYYNKQYTYLITQEKHSFASITEMSDFTRQLHFHNAQLSDEQKQQNDDAADNLAQEVINLNNEIHREILRLQNEKKSWLRNKLKNAYLWLQDKLTLLSEMGGTIGFVTNLIIETFKLAKKIGSHGMTFFEGVSAPLALSAIAAATLQETIELYNDPTLQERNVRYGSNITSLGLLGAAIAVSVGALTVLPVPIALPLLFLGIQAAAYYKETRLLAATLKEIETVDKARRKDRESLVDAVEYLLKNDATIKLLHQQYCELTAIPESQRSVTTLSDINNLQSQITQKLYEDPRVEGLSLRIRAHNNRLDTLAMTARQLDSSLTTRQIIMYGVGVLLAGSIMALFPPLALVAGIFAVAGGLVILGGVIASIYEKKQYQKQKKELRETQRTQSESSIALDELNIIGNAYTRARRRQPEPGSTAQSAVGLARRIATCPRALVSGNLDIVAPPPSPGSGSGSAAAAAPLARSVSPTPVVNRDTLQLTPR